MSIRDQVHAVLAVSFPAQSAKTRIDFVRVVERRDGRLGVVVRLVARHDVIEQEIALVPPTDLLRFAAFASALVRVVSRALAYPGASRHMPIDFIKFDALQILTAVTEEDFEKELGAKARLGRYLTAPRPAPGASM